MKTLIPALAVLLMACQPQPGSDRAKDADAPAPAAAAPAAGQPDPTEGTAIESSATNGAIRVRAGIMSGTGDGRGHRNTGPRRTGRVDEGMPAPGWRVAVA